MSVDPQLALEKARAICQKYELDAELQPLPGGEVVLVIVNPNRSDKSILDTSQDIRRQLESELKSEVPCYRI